MLVYFCAAHLVHRRAGHVAEIHTALEQSVAIYVRYYPHVLVMLPFLWFLLLYIEMEMLLRTPVSTTIGLLSCSLIVTPASLMAPGSSALGGAQELARPALHA
ncbi:unnamed protein product [Prorocentrum cordatum]|uniref:Uncharacterized protein n=1 Tax=Prorocentrum cordatum TaxID=2364126 RepID=A0ABN9T8M8_9DINO|nr:unnamed protein product [Polarella glacialis]